MENSASFQAIHKKFGEFFERTHTYRIPRFQRPYSWEEDQVIDFWEDLVSETSATFIGSFVFNHEYLEQEGVVDIIDGQQRLLTTTIFIAAARNYLKSLDGGQQRAESLHRYHIVYENFTGEQRPRVTVGESASKFFAQTIQDFDGDPGSVRAETKEEKRIRANYEFFLRKITGKCEQTDSLDAKIEAIDALIKRLRSTFVIEIQIASEEDAFEIFETVNARGIELSVGDLLKNLIFKKITESTEASLDQLHDRWKALLESLDGTGFELPKFIRYHWISQRKFVGEKLLFKSIKRQTADFEVLLAELSNAADLLSRLTNPAPEKFKADFDGYEVRISRYLEGLRLMRVTQCYAFLLALFRVAPHLKAKRLMETVGLIERFSFLYTLIGKGAGNRVEKMYSKHAISLTAACEIEDRDRRATTLSNVLSDLKKEMHQIRPERDEFLKNFMEIRYKNSQKARQIAGYILHRINGHLSTEETQPDFEKVNLEHFLPQKPDRTWGLSEKDVKEYVHLLGNLTLLGRSINSRSGNESLHDKVESLRESELAVTRRLISRVEESAPEYTWNEQEICKRQEELGELAYDEVWSIS